MSKYINPYFEEFKKLVCSKYRVNEKFQFKVELSPNGRGGEQILTGYIDSDGDLNTVNSNQDNINGVDYEWGESWKTVYKGTFELIESTRTLRDIKVGDIIEDGSRSFRVAEIYGVTFSAYPTDHAWYNLTVLSFDQCETEGFVITNQKAVPEPVVEKIETPKPKFKIGDVVIYRSLEENDMKYVISTISVIKLSKTGFIYTLPSGGDYSEMQIELYTD